MTAEALAQNGAVSPDQVAQKYGRLVASVCRRMTRDPELARDAAQEVWLEVVKALPSFRGDSSLATWIFQVTWRVSRRYAARERRYSVRFLRRYFEQGEIPSPRNPDPDKVVWVKEMCDKCLAGTLQCIDPESRLDCILRDVAEAYYAEIGRVMEREEAAARQIIARARRRLNGFLKGQCTLYNPTGRCKCRMKRHVQEIDLAAEYAKIRGSARRVRLFRESEQILPSKNYWRDLI